MAGSRRPRLRPLLFQALGYGFLVLGVVGLVVPVLQGILCLLIGLLILARHATWADRLLIRLRRRFPRLDGLIEKAESRAERWRVRLFGPS